MTLIKSTLFVSFLILPGLAMADAFIGTDGTPTTGAQESPVNNTFVYDETATVDGDITKIEVYVSISANDLQVAVFSKSVNDFTDLDSAVSLDITSSGAVLYTFDAPADFTAMPISIGQYIGAYLGASARLEAISGTAPGYWFDGGDQIGDNAASTFGLSGNTDYDIQIRCTITTADGAVGQVIMMFGD